MRDVIAPGFLWAFVRVPRVCFHRELIAATAKLEKKVDGGESVQSLVVSRLGHSGSIAARRIVALKTAAVSSRAGKAPKEWVHSSRLVWRLW